MLIVSAFGAGALGKVLSLAPPWSEQVQVFSIEGHRRPVEPATTGSTRVESIAIGGLESINVIPDGGAGGMAQLAGTYQVGDHREPSREVGLSGTLVVHDRTSAVAGIEPLNSDLSEQPQFDPPDTGSPPVTTAAPTESNSSSPDTTPGIPVAIGLVALGGAGASFIRRRAR